MKKTEAVSVKIRQLADPLFDDHREEFGPPVGGLAERIRFLAFYPSAAAARYIGLVTFSRCREKVTARPTGGLMLGFQMTNSYFDQILENITNSFPHNYIN